MPEPPPGSHGQPDPSQKIMFDVLIIPLFPSVVCFIFLFYNFIRNRQIRMKPTNRFFIYLLIISSIQIIIDLPARLYFFLENTTIIQTSMFCLFWNWYDNILTVTNLYIMAFSSVDRYFFVFHNIFYGHHTILIVYIPMLLCFLVPAVYFSGVIFAYPCTNFFVYSFWQCGALCYQFNSVFLRTFENYAYLMVPTFIIVLGNITLLIRVLMQKHSMKEQGHIRLWRRNMRMIFQLVSVAILYMGAFVPSSVFLYMDAYGPNGAEEMWISSVRVHYLFHIKYFVIFLSPFVILIGQTEMHERIKQLFRYIRRQRNGATVLPMNDMTRTLPIVTKTLAHVTKQ